MTTTPRPDPDPRLGGSDEPTTVIRTRRNVVAEQRRRYGGFRWGSAFFGWLTATGTALLLTALALAVGAVGGVTSTPNATGQVIEQTGRAAQDPATAGPVGLTAAIVLLVVVFLAYLA